MEKLRENLWRGFGALALLYMISWVFGLIVWYFPETTAMWTQTYEDAVRLFLFVTLGLIGFMVSGYVVWACFTKEK